MSLILQLCRAQRDRLMSQLGDDGAPSHRGALNRVTETRWSSLGYRRPKSPRVTMPCYGCGMGMGAWSLASYSVLFPSRWFRTLGRPPAPRFLIRR